MGGKRFYIHKISWGLAIPLALFVGGLSAQRSLSNAVIDALITFFLVVAVMEWLRRAGLWDETSQG